jgi:4-amino-4-deoxy-L-arabinose transferase-like glycosyltransferase
MRNALKEPPFEREDSAFIQYALVFVLLLAGLIRVLSYCGYYGSDDGAYAELSNQLLHHAFPMGNYSGPPVFPLRLGLIVPTTLSIAMAGVSELSILAYPFMISLASVLLAFYFGKLLFDEKTGLLAALITALMPIEARSASMLLPDMSAAFWANFGLFLLVLSIRKPQQSARNTLACVGGLLLGISWLHKESVVFLIFFLVLWMVGAIWQKNSKHARLVALAIGSFMIVLFLESVFYWFLTGDAFFHLHETERNYVVAGTWFFTEGSGFGWEGGGYARALIYRLFVQGPETIFLNFNFGFVPLLAMIVVALSAIMRRGKFLLPAMWFLTLVVMFNFSSASLAHYMPLTLFDRYLYPALLPASILVAATVTSFWSDTGARQGGRTYAVVIGILALAFMIPATLEIIRQGAQSEAERLVSRIVPPSATLYTDPRSLTTLQFFYGYPVHFGMRDFSGKSGGEIPPGAYVLVNYERLAFLNRAYTYAVPEWAIRPPSPWKLRWKGSTAILLQIPG